MIDCLSARTACEDALPTLGHASPAQGVREHHVALLLLVAQGHNRIEARCSTSGIEAKENPNRSTEQKRTH